MKEDIRQEKWWNKREFFISMGIAILLTAGFLQGYLVGKWEAVIPSYFTGSLIAYAIMRWLAIRREKQDMAEMEALEKECKEKLKEACNLQRQSHLIMSLHSNDNPPVQ